MPPINLLIKTASSLCNMKCDYCFYIDESKKRDNFSYGLMTDSTLKNVIRKGVLYSEGACTIAFQGGEPTLSGLDFFKNMINYVKQYNKNNVRISYSLQTNGYAITEEWCEFFSKHNFLLGLSVDGTEKIHDSYRHTANGGGTYQRIIKTADLFDRYHIDYNVLTVVHKEVAENIADIYREYKNRGWNYLQFIACLDPLGERRGGKEFSLLSETYGRFLIQLFDLWYQDYLKGEQPYIRQFENYIVMLMGYYPESCEQKGICSKQYVIESDGSVYPCDFYVLDEYKLGNLNQASMKDIESKREEIGFIQRSVNMSEKCVSCQWKSLCKGGCYRHRDGLSDNYFCTSYKMFFEACYERMRKISNQIMNEKRMY